jgi:nitrate reductase gamma subunit
MTVKNRFILLLIPLLVTLYGFDSEASWIIDSVSFHISAHGQTACLDCHEVSADRDLHPDPDNVTKNLRSLFNYETCIDCHDDVGESMDELELEHGTEQIKDLDEFKACLECHDPHYEMASDVAEGKFDPDLSPFKQCGACHEEQKTLPSLSKEEEDCMACHGLVVEEGTLVKAESKTMCLHCHADEGTRAQDITGLQVPLIDPDQFEKNPHPEMDCLECHIEADRFEHNKLSISNCRACHPPHDEKVAHDAHLSLSCQACHVQGMVPVRDNKTLMVMGEIEFEPGQQLDVHSMNWPGEEQCLRCHYSGNSVGAASAVLPPKSLLCMPCHAGTFSLKDTPSRIGLFVFILGLLLTISTWLTGGLHGKPKAGLLEKLFGLCVGTVRIIFSFRIFTVLRTLFFDVLLQRRLFNRSKGRWFIHAMIFYPFLFRFSWGLFSLIGSLASPESTWIWPMLDKNHPLTAAFFEFSGILLLLGIVLAFIRGRHNKADLAGVPRQDIPALGIIAVIVIIGFILEGIRMAMTGFPETGVYAPLGLLIGKLFSGSSLVLVDIYQTFWYVHAGFNAIFIAYIPFSRLLHIIPAPIVLVMGATSGQERG